MRIAAILVVLPVLLSVPVQADEPEGRWRLTLDVTGLGVLETVVDFDEGACLSGHSISTAPARHREIFDDTTEEPFVTLRVCGPTPGGVTGELTTVLGDADLSWTVQSRTLTGTFVGEIAGTITGIPFEGALPLRDYAAVLHDVEQHTNTWLYDPRLKQTDDWEQFQDRFGRASRVAQDDFDMLAGFQRAWGDGFFSHYELLRPLQSMDEMVEHADVTAEETPVAHVAFTEDNIAIITIDSFFGARIADQIDQAFTAAIEADARALILDVRENGGGTLAAWPVAARLVQHEVLAGYFLTGRWWGEHKTLPTTAYLDSTPSPVEVTPEAFQRDLFADDLLVMRVVPWAETYSGPVYALISERSASATEAVIGLLQYADRVEVVGKTSAGYMLNSNIFEVSAEYSIRIPTADFLLPNHRSLEGVGVIPDIETDAGDALTVALERARR